MSTLKSNTTVNYHGYSAATAAASQVIRTPLNSNSSAGINAFSINSAIGRSIGIPRLVAAVALGGAVTFSIFVLMHHFIASTTFVGFNETSDARPVVRINPEYPAVAS
jgi:hypothetical protein